MLRLMPVMILASLAGMGIRWGIGSSLWGILAVNSLGSLIAGYAGGLQRPENPYITALIVGFCGCLTTYSGFALNLVRLWEQGEIFKIAIHFTLNNAMCLLLCYAGWSIAQKI